MLISIPRCIITRKNLMTTSEQELIRAFLDMEPFVPVNEEYRAYYDNDGWVTSFAASNFVEGKWIHITKEVYNTQVYQWLRVVDGKLIKDIPVNRHVFQLTRSDKGVKVVKNHAGIVIESSEIYADTEYYDRTN